jgi:major type 1 subunit fimbrin (pilin)
VFQIHVEKLCFSMMVIFLASHGAPAQSNSGTVNFSGSVSAPTCTVSGSAGASGSGNGITVPMGDVPITELTSGDWVSAHSNSFVLTALCPGSMAGYTRTRFTFNAPGGSGVDPNDTRMLRLSAGSQARGVAVGVYVSGSFAPLNMGAAPSTTGNFVVSGGNSMARIDLRAQYKRTSAVPMAGSANATLPLTLTYE